MAPCASAAEPKESDDLETVCASGHVLDSEREDPSPASQPALRRQTSAVGAVCSNSASTDLCGGRQVTDVPTATKLFWVVISRCAATRNPSFCWILAMRNSSLRSQWRVPGPFVAVGTSVTCRHPHR